MKRRARLGGREDRALRRLTLIPHTASCVRWDWRRTVHYGREEPLQKGPRWCGAGFWIPHADRRNVTKLVCQRGGPGTGFFFDNIQVQSTVANQTGRRKKKWKIRVRVYCGSMLSKRGVNVDELNGQ